MNSFLQDLRYAIPLLIKSPGVTATAVIALSLGIGANTSIFSLVNGAFLRPPPGVHEPNQMVTLERTQDGKVQYSSGYPDYVYFRDNNHSFEGLAAHCGTPLSFSRDETERVRGDLVSGNYFSVLGVKPAVGRLISPADDAQPGPHPVAVLSYAFWLRAFGADPEISGNSIKLNGH